MGRLTKVYRPIMVKVDKNSPLYPMAHGGMVAEHRIVMAESLGRTLGSDEFVHHLDGDAKNNHLSNLKLVTGRDRNNALKYLDLLNSRIRIKRIINNLELELRVINILIEKEFEGPDPEEDS